ncbi:MAG: tetratricopeptide repeat protein [Pyrinomonadaceae bacterium]
MSLRHIIFLFVAVITAAQLAGSQTLPIPSPAPKISVLLEKNLKDLALNPDPPRERREQAYAKLLEAQRNLWMSGRLQSHAGKANALKLAKQGFQKAVDLNPSLAEGYTALAELETRAGSADIEEAISLAAMATKIEPDNFGGHRLLARLYTIKSFLNDGVFNPVFATKAVAEWNHVTRLDPRNAEGWAFLSAFYEKTGKPAEQIGTLKKWLGSASPPDVDFYARIMGGRESLAPESAYLKLGEALIKAGRIQEAVETLTVLIADDPDNAEAIDILREAVESTDGPTAGVAIESLQRAFFINPGNMPLLNLLARVLARAGNLEDAVKLLRGSAEKLRASDLAGASALHVTLGDLYNGGDRYGEAITFYEEAMKIRGVHHAQTLAADEREFVMHVFEKMIQTHKLSNRPNDVRLVIDRARKLLGKDDLFADRQLISFYRETGNKPQALASIRAVRIKYPDDYGFIRLEATLLAETGQVDEAVTLIKSLAGRKPAVPVTGSSANSRNTLSAFLPGYDEFSNYLFISNLYSQANRGKEAADAANQAFLIARGNERKQIARLTLATAQQMSGDFKGAETTLRDILKQTPGNPIALNNLGYFLLERDEHFEEALDLIRQALKVDPTNPSYLDSLGWAYFKLGRLTDAEKFLKDAARIDTGSAAIQEHLGDLYQKQGKAGLAKEAWEKALRLASDRTDIERLKDKLEK